MTSARLGSGKSVADQKAACRTPCVLHVRHVGDRAEIENTWGLQMSPLLPSKRRRVKNYYFFWGIWAALPIVEYATLGGGSWGEQTLGAICIMAKRQMRQLTLHPSHRGPRLPHCKYLLVRRRSKPPLFSELCSSPGYGGKW